MPSLILVLITWLNSLLDHQPCILRIIYCNLHEVVVYLSEKYDSLHWVNI